jgi:arylsulfatase A-like enzyme
MPHAPVLKTASPSFPLFRRSPRPSRLSWIAGQPPLLVRSLFGGIAAGALLGGVLGVAGVTANHYLVDGYPQLALGTIRASLDRFVLAGGLLFLLLALTERLLAAALRRRGREAHPAWGWTAALAIVVATGIILWRLRISPWTPHVLSPRGVPLFGGVALAGALGAWGAMRYGETVGRGVRSALRWLSGAEPVASALLLLLAVHLVSAASAPSVSAMLAGRPSHPRLNVLLITIDALRADHLGAYGYSRPTSPNIDRLARESVRFDRAVSQWPLTSPSFAALMSGTYAHTNGLLRTTAQRMPDRPLMLAELFQAGGYSTRAAVGNVNLARVFNFDQGFDTYRELWREEDQQQTRAMTRSGLELLGDASQSRPFFVWLHFFDPHARYQPPKPFDGMFLKDSHFDPSWRVPLYSESRRNVGGIAANVNLGTEDRVAYYVAQYDAEIRYVDEQVGVLLKALEERGLAKNTVVVLTSDHGESLGDHNYFFDHGRFPYDDCVHVPMIVRAPGIGKPGEVVTSPVQLIDLVPTLLDLTGLPPNPNAEGKSLRRLLAGEHPGGTRWAYAFTESGYAQNYQRSITSEHYKLVYVPDTNDRRFMKGSELELYDLKADPKETKNLIAEQPEVADHLKKELWSWMESSGASAAVPAAVHLDHGTEAQLRSLGYIE